jgi:translation initiation factor IF-1
LEKDIIKIKGTVSELLPSLFRVKLENGHEVMCHLSGKIKRNNIRVSQGDVVDIEMSIHDFTKGRIVYRHR